MLSFPSDFIQWLVWCRAAYMDFPRVVMDPIIVGLFPSEGYAPGNTMTKSVCSAAFVDQVKPLNDRVSVYLGGQSFDQVRRLL